MSAACLGRGITTVDALVVPGKVADAAAAPIIAVFAPLGPLLLPRRRRGVAIRESAVAPSDTDVTGGGSTDALRLDAPPGAGTFSC